MYAEVQATLSVFLRWLCFCMLLQLIDGEGVQLAETMSASVSVGSSDRTARTFATGTLDSLSD